MVTVVELLRSVWRWEKHAEGQPSLKHSTNLDFIYRPGHTAVTDTTNGNRHVYWGLANQCVTLLLLVITWFCWLNMLNLCLSCIRISEKCHAVIWWLLALISVCRCGVNSLMTEWPNRSLFLVKTHECRGVMHSLFLKGHEWGGCCHVTHSSHNSTYVLFIYFIFYSKHSQTH